MNKITGFILLLAAACAPAVLYSEDPAPSIPAAFMEQLVKGINGRDLGSLRPIIHADTLACMTPETEDYYRWLLWRDGSKRYTIPSQYKADLAPAINIRDYEPKAADKDSALLRWPVQPDSGLLFAYEPAPKTRMQRTLEITLKNGEARLVMDCPTAAGLETFRKMAQKDKARKQRLAHVWQTLNPVDREAFQMMASQGRKLEIMQGAEMKLGLSADDSPVFMDMIVYGDTP